MDINQNLQQTNTFQGGMDTDTSDMFLDSSRYRLAKNLRYSASGTGDLGELHSIEGVSDYIKDKFYNIYKIDRIRNYGIIIGSDKFLYHTILKDSTEYVKLIPSSVADQLYRDGLILNIKGSFSGYVSCTIYQGTPASFSTVDWQPVAMYNMLDKDTDYTIKINNGTFSVTNKYRIVFDHQVSEQYGTFEIKALNSGISKWGIYTFDYNEGISSLHSIFGLCSDYLNTNNISTVCRWESDNNVKLYIADGTNPLMCINIKHSELMNNDDIHNDIKYLYATPQYLFPKINVHQSPESAEFDDAAIVYSYMLYNPKMGTTQMSPLSEYNYHKKDSHSLYTINIFGLLDSQFSHIIVYRVAYKHNGQLPDVHIIYDDLISKHIDVSEDGDFFTIDDTGGNVSLISVEEFNVLRGFIFSPKSIESKNDILFAANVDTSVGVYKPDWDVNDNMELYKIDYTSTLTYNSRRSPIRTLRSGETYRYGIILYNKDGLRSDIMLFDDYTVGEGYRFEKLLNNKYGITAHPEQVGARLKSGKAFPEDAFAVEFVKCIRTLEHTKNIAQCVISGVLDYTNIQKIDRFNDINSDFVDYQNQSTDKSLITSQPVVTTYPITEGFYDAKVLANNKKPEDDILFVNNSIDHVQLISPDIAYQPDDINNAINSNRCYLNPVAFLSKGAYSGNLIKYDDAVQISAQSISGYNDGLPVIDNNYALITRVVSNSTSSRTIMPYSIEWNELTNELGPTNKRFVFAYFDHDNDNVISRRSLLYNKIFTAGNFGSTFDNGCNLYNSYIIGEREADNNFVHFPTYISNISGSYPCSIDKTIYPKALQWNDFGSSDIQELLNKSSVIGDKNYLNWCIGTTNEIASNGQKIYKKWNTDSSLEALGTCQLTGPSGKCLVAKIDSQLLQSLQAANVPVYTIPQIVCNISKQASKYSESDQLYSYGQYYVLDGNTSLFLVDEGDSYCVLHYHMQLKKWYNPNCMYASKFSSLYMFPLESSINTDMDSGEDFELSEQGGYIDLNDGYIQEEPCSISVQATYGDWNININHTQEKPLYAYNTVFNTVPTIVPYLNIKDNYSSDVFDHRVHYSQIKTNGENIDSWSKFLAMNFLDVDSRYGQITNLKTFKDRLIFWQENATGVLSVNERQIAQSTTGVEIILGTGGVLERFDYFTTLYGIKAGHRPVAESNYNLYWWDANKMKMMQLSENTVIDMQNKYLMQNYISDKITKDKPCIFYDPKHNEVVFNVVYKLLNGEVKNESVVYNELINRFSSIYDLKLDGAILFDNDILIDDQNNIYKWNQNTKLNTEGDTIYPELSYVVNDKSQIVKVYDNCKLGVNLQEETDKDDIDFNFKTKSQSSSGVHITNREYDYRFAIPRDNNAQYGGRMRGRTMDCDFTFDNTNDISLFYVITKYRISWS